jgi:hypothetical protein
LEGERGGGRGEGEVGKGWHRTAHECGEWKAAGWMWGWEAPHEASLVLGAWNGAQSCWWNAC